MEGCVDGEDVGRVFLCSYYYLGMFVSSLVLKDSEEQEKYGSMQRRAHFRSVLKSVEEKVDRVVASQVLHLRRGIR